MSVTYTAILRGSDRALQLLDPRKLKRCAITGAVASAHDAVNRLMEYPPATSANRPGRFTSQGRPLGYYERNRGYWRPIVNAVTMRSFGHFGKSVGRIKASATQRKTGTVYGYKLDPSSEQLGKRWKVRRTPTGAIITNRATYAPFVQSAARQSAVMRSIGWKTDQSAIRETWNAGVFRAAFEQAMRSNGLIQ